MTRSNFIKSAFAVLVGAPVAALATAGDRTFGGGKNARVAAPGGWITPETNYIEVKSGYVMLDHIKSGDRRGRYCGILIDGVDITRQAQEANAPEGWVDVILLKFPNTNRVSIPRWKRLPMEHGADGSVASRIAIERRYGVVKIFFDATKASGSA